MMLAILPDLGQYAGNVLGAYAVSLVLMAVLIIGSFKRAANVKKQLSDLEAQQKRQKTDG